MNSENHYLYFNGEKENPFNKEDDNHLNRLMWWHYEFHHFHFERQNQKFLKLEDYIKDVLNNKVDYGDLDGKLFRMYQNSSTKSVED
jgi:hypothetical protein